MNISTGGPHVLLFERDQQLAALLISELQLVGYTCYTARTAVEVFDTIARYSIRLVLVNLAQAAATRREFWVALDTQRRDRKVQVLTFLCTNLAGYGPRDMDDHNPNIIADVEVDGMLGLMGFVDIIQTRVPVGGTVDANTLPRIPRTNRPQANNSTANATTYAQNSSSDNNRFSALAQQRPQATTSYQATNNESFQRSAPTGAEQGFSRPPASTTQPVASTPNAPAAIPSNPVVSSMQTAHLGQTTPQQATTGAQANAQPSYTDKIRAILYPNQKTWDSSSSGGNGGQVVPQERKEIQGTVSVQVPLTPMPPAPPPNSMLQQLADGQSSTNGNGSNYGESGLAQLSRLIQRNREPQQEENREQRKNSMPVLPDASVQSAEQMMRTAMPEFSNTQTENNFAQSSMPEVERPLEQRQPDGAERSATTHNAATTNEEIPLRASPIQDIPIERTVGASPTIEGGRRPDVFSRTNYNQPVGQQGVTTTQMNMASTPPLASITAIPPTPTSNASIYTSRAAALSAWEIQSREIESSIPRTEQEETIANTDEEESETSEGENRDESRTTSAGGPNNPHTDAAVLLDIVQSLPPMPEILSQPSAMQPQALNGRATRSLNKVLLEGHLVPQDRLEVAQNIQRMLRGVDLNYQLGEILLMFKLLTPDQLLAASLVSYGLITTTQISALGHIRQELHAIGLEYDLENLLILFRILTPEQLREVRSGLQN